MYNCFFFAVEYFFNELNVTNNPVAGKVNFSAAFDVAQRELKENGRPNATQSTFLFTARNIDYPMNIESTLREVNMVYLVGKYFFCFLCI